MESVYEQCLCYELSQLGVSFKRQVDLPVSYKGIKLGCGYKMDLVVEDQVVLELKAVDQLLPIHTAQLLTYLKLSGKRVGLLLNFHAPTLAKGIKRLLNDIPNNFSVPSVSSVPSGFDFENSVSRCLRGESERAMK